MTHNYIFARVIPEYNSLDEVLAELDRKWASCHRADFDAHEYYLSSIRFRGFNFRIAIYECPYRIEKLDSNFVLNAKSKEAILSFIEDHKKLSEELGKLI